MSSSHDRARKVLETEAAAILALVPRLNESFEQATDLLFHCRGRVVLTGMGKSGLIARKIAATLSSTGTPAIFMHAAEAVHGDLGVIQSDDIIVALSYGGETPELLHILEAVRRLGARIIALTGNMRSTLAEAADIALDCSVDEEACPLNLVPTASTTATLALGDAIAMTLLDLRGFQQGDFAALHPGGRLGKRLTRVEALMHRGEQCPRVSDTAPMPDVIYEMSRHRLGMTCVVNADGELLGVITDGDLRRHMQKTDDVMRQQAQQVMTTNPVTVEPQILAAEALHIMEERKITALVVASGSPARPVGVVHLHDLWGTALV